MAIRASRFALGLLLASPFALQAQPTVESLELSVRHGEAVQHETLGVVFRADPVFATTRNIFGSPVLAFKISLSYAEPGVSEPDRWVIDQLIPNIDGEERVFGPFTNLRGTHYRITAVVGREDDRGQVRFTLESDNFELETAYREQFSQPAFLLHTGKIRYPNIWALKVGWQVYTTVSFTYDAVRFVQGTLAFKTLVVQVVVELAIGEIISRIPDHYEGAVAYTCTYCGYQGELEEIRSCRIVVCPNCGQNRARICLRRLVSGR